MPLLRRLILRATMPVRRTLLRRRVGRLVVEEVEGIPLVVLPTVFNPAVFRSSDAIVRVIRGRSGPGSPGRALDVGCGTGVLAVAAALAGHDVVAVDLNPDAARCTRINALLNGVEARIDVREGDLFAPVAGEQFDLVVCNPPFFRGRPRDRLDMAWRSEQMVERFASGLPQVLAPSGRALLVFSSHADEAAAVAAIERAGLAAAVCLVLDLANEVVTVFDIRHRAGDAR